MIVHAFSVRRCLDEIVVINHHPDGTQTEMAYHFSDAPQLAALLLAAEGEARTECECGFHHDEDA